MRKYCPTSLAYLSTDMYGIVLQYAPQAKITPDVQKKLDKLYTFCSFDSTKGAKMKDYAEAEGCTSEELLDVYIKANVILKDDVKKYFDKDDVLAKHGETLEFVLHAHLILLDMEIRKMMEMEARALATAFKPLAERVGYPV